VKFVVLKNGSNKYIMKIKKFDYYTFLKKKIMNKNTDS